jgi:hypothetical protein
MVRPYLQQNQTEISNLYFSSSKAMSKYPSPRHYPFPILTLIFQSFLSLSALYSKSPEITDMYPLVGLNAQIFTSLSLSFLVSPVYSLFSGSVPVV